MKGEGGGGFYQTDVGKALDIYKDFQIMGGGGRGDNFIEYIL